MDDSIHKLARLFARFPGIGERQSKRFVYFLLREKPEYISELVDKIKLIRNNVSSCPECFVLFETDGHTLCDICGKSTTDQSTIMIVEKDADCESIKKSRIYNGRYFIIGGLINLLEKDKMEKVRIKEFLTMMNEKLSKSKIKEVIIALSLNPAGDYTDHHIKELLKPLQEKNPFIVSSLGRGLSTGTELEYSDNDTIKNAFKNRA